MLSVKFSRKRDVEMTRGQDINVYSEDPDKILDILARVVKKMSAVKLPQIPEDKVVQYEEISKTIDRLKDAGTTVPDELRRLKIELAGCAEERKQAETRSAHALLSLQTIEGRLASLLTDVRAGISRLSNKPVSQKKQRRYVKRTSPVLLSRELKKAIRELGGAAKKADVLQRVRQNMDGKFKELDLERDAQGDLNWEKWLVAEKTKLLKAGVLKVGANFGIWELRKK